MPDTLPAFQTVHEAYRPRIVRYLRSLVGPDEAEDVAQVVMLNVSQHLAEFRGDAALATWIFRIATHAALDRLRSRARREAEVTDPLEEDLPALARGWTIRLTSMPSAETRVIQGEMTSCIREFVDRLPDPYRLVLLLSELEGFTNPEIATILDVSVDVVKIRLHRARARLRRDLEQGCSLYHDERNELACDRKAEPTSD